VKTSRVDNIVEKIKNNPISALLIIVGIFVITLSTFTDSLNNLLTTIEDLIGSLTPIDISGKWQAEKPEETSRIYFDFKAVDDKLYGTVTEYFESGILDGRIIGNRVTFTTKREVVREFGHYNSQTGEKTPDVLTEVIVHYDGEIRGDEIHFRRLTGEGRYAEIIAKKIVDLTEIAGTSASLEKNNGYEQVYVLPGHEDGVQSLSFGPDHGRLITGGLMLASGGSKDGKIKYWDVATAESWGTRDLPATKNGGRVHLAYSPKTRKGGLDLTSVGVSKDEHKATFFDLHFWLSSNQVSGGGKTPKPSGQVELVVISGDAHLSALAETEASSKHTITVRDADGDVKRTLNCEGMGRAISLSFDGNLLASAETTESNETILKLWDAATGAVKWRISSQSSINHLAFSPDSRWLASAGIENGRIRVWEVNTGLLKFTLPEEQDNGISFITFSNSGKLLAAAGLPSGVIKLWNASTGTLDQTIKNEETVGALSFSYDDRLLATGSSDTGVVKVWAKPKNEKIIE